MSNANDQHQFDGIVEENNKMPTWWVWLFILTVIFSGLYYLHYEFGGGVSLQQEFEIAMKDLKAKQDSAPFGYGVTDEVLALLEKNPETLLAGQKLYQDKCAMCHGGQLEGKIGPNLTDKYWIHGKGKHKDIFIVIGEGQADKGMPPWKGVLKEDEIKSLTAFIHTKIGSNPAEPKGPQGEPVEN